MKYKVDDVVVLKCRHDVIGHSNAVRIEYTDPTIGRYYSAKVINGVFDDKDIDDEKTAEYNEKNNELEKVVAAKNQVVKLSDDYLMGMDKHKLMNSYGRTSSDVGIIQPNHYKKNDMDLIDNFKNLFDEKEFRAVMKSNVFRYVTRYEEKNGIEDLFKAIEFIERLVEWEESLE